jgi:hypothetical protein
MQGVDAGPKRYSVQRKMAVARLLRGEPLDVVGREANVSAAKLTEWWRSLLVVAASTNAAPSNRRGFGRL